MTIPQISKGESTLRTSTLIAFILALMAGGQTANKTTVHVPLQPGQAELVAVLTFDADRVSTEDLKKWMRLHETAYYHTPIVSGSTDCEPVSVPRLEEDIRKTQQLIEELNPSNYPKQAADVVEYLKSIQSFWLWKAQQELAFLKSGTLPPNEYKGTKFGKCQVSNAPKHDKSLCTEVMVRWQACMNEEMMRRFGSYPAQKWKAFLDAFGIQERLEMPGE
jgi:hypothetical protein